MPASPNMSKRIHYLKLMVMLSCAGLRNVSRIQKSIIYIRDSKA